jgi:mxaC protein
MVSAIAAFILRLTRSASLVLLAIGLSGPYLPEKEVERIGEGAQIVLLLDRSRSMDQPFGGQPFKNPLLPSGAETKGTVSRRLLSEFVADRRNDKYGMLVFSTEPIQVLPLTDKTEIIQAAIEAGNIGRGLSETNVGPGIIDAIGFFADKSYTGSRVILLVSDGGARLDIATRIQIADMLKRFRVALYWIYIRSRNSPGIVAANAGEKRDDVAPARVLHEFFETLETPYRAFDAEDPSALAAAIAEVNELQSLPIQYVDVVPRKSIANWFYGAAMVLVFLLLIVDRTELRRW